MEVDGKLMVSSAQEGLDETQACPAEFHDFRGVSSDCAVVKMAISAIGQTF